MLCVSNGLRERERERVRDLDTHRYRKINGIFVLCIPRDYIALSLPLSPPPSPSPPSTVTIVSVKAVRASKRVEASGTHTTPVQHRYSGHASRPLRLGHYLPRSSRLIPLHFSLYPSLRPQPLCYSPLLFLSFPWKYRRFLLRFFVFLLIP